MKSFKIKTTVQLTLEKTIDYLLSLLQQHGFTVISVTDLKATLPQTQIWKRYTLMRSIYPKKNLINEWFAALPANLLRCSILIQELAAMQVKIEFSRSNRSGSTKEAHQLKAQAEQKLNQIINDLQILANSSEGTHKMEC